MYLKKIKAAKRFWRKRKFEIPFIASRFNHKTKIIERLSFFDLLNIIIKLTMRLIRQQYAREKVIMARNFKNTSQHQKKELVTRNFG